MATSLLRNDECELCGEDILVGWLEVKDAKGQTTNVKLRLQPDEVQVFAENLGYVVGYERHWKYCEKRVEAGAGSNAPPEKVNSGDIHATRKEIRGLREDGSEIQ